MDRVGVDLEQFVTDPYASGIQRVLQYLAGEWPTEDIPAEFVIPCGAEYLLLTPSQAAELVGLAFVHTEEDSVRRRVDRRVGELARSAPHIQPAMVPARFSSWLVPEVSYLPSVLTRLRLLGESMPTAMVGYDALPMTESYNYRFPPGVARWVSTYFRSLATVSSVVCISDHSREEIVTRLRRSDNLLTTVASPGGDHVPLQTASRRAINQESRPVTFLRLGTLEARKMPLEILEAFRLSRESGVDARLVYVGNPSVSDRDMTRALDSAANGGWGVEWVRGASDGQVVELLQEADLFLSVGAEGYGIPVLEAIRQGVPVLYGGIQPAAELMEGDGATCIGEPSVPNLSAAFSHYANIGKLEGLRNSVDGVRVPRWSDFAMQVAHACVG